MMPNPEIFVLSGPNGAGKSTTATVLLPDTLSIEQFVNADLIAQGSGPFSPVGDAVEAGRVMLGRIHQLRDRGESFALETTLASRSYVPFLRQAQEAGYLVHIAYIWLVSVDLALSRIALRVQQGGYDVPRETVERRYLRGLRNFFELHRPLANTWTLCDNSGEELVIVARSERDAEPEVLHQQKYDTIRRQSGHAP